MKGIQHTHGIFRLSGFTYPNTGDQDKQSHEAGYQLTK